MEAPEGMLTEEDDVEIHALARRGWSVSAIARHTGGARKTVRKSLAGPAAPRQPPPSGLQPFRDYLVARFADDAHVDGTVLYREVVELGFERAYVTFVRQLRVLGLRPRCEACRTGGHGVTVELSHEPGEEIQFDWLGPDPHGLGKHNTGLLKDPFTADETIALLKRLDAAAGDTPWLTVCSFLNPHDDSLFGVIALAHGLRYHPSQVPHLDQAPTHEEDLSTKPLCQQSYVDNWSTILAPQPWNEIHLKFYYQMQAEVGRQISRVLDALRDTEAHENTIVIFSCDHGDMHGAHGGMHEKWHVAYEEALHLPFIVSSPLLRLQ